MSLLFIKKKISNFYAVNMISLNIYLLSEQKKLRRSFSGRKNIKDCTVVTNKMSRRLDHLFIVYQIRSNRVNWFLLELFITIHNHSFIQGLKEALVLRKLTLKAKVLMSDFEPNIRLSFQYYFTNITPKGCHFHYAKVTILNENVYTLIKNWQIKT